MLCRLLPALLRFGEEGAPETGRRTTLRYVEHCITRLELDDPAVHHFAVSISLCAGCPLACRALPCLLWQLSEQRAGPLMLWRLHCVRHVTPLRMAAAQPVLSRHAKFGKPCLTGHKGSLGDKPYLTGHQGSPAGQASAHRRQGLQGNWALPSRRTQRNPVPCLALLLMLPTSCSLWQQLTIQPTHSWWACTTQACTVFLDKVSSMPAREASAQISPRCSTSLQVALYTLDSDEAPLLQYLASARDVLGRPLYDPQFALRLARQRGCLRACITLFCDVGMYEVGPTSSHMLTLPAPSRAIWAFAECVKKQAHALAVWVVACGPASSCSVTWGMY